MNKKGGILHKQIWQTLEGAFNSKKVKWEKSVENM
jgi:hypothetical protein